MNRLAAHTAQARTDTPLGPVTLAATERGLAGLWFDGQAHHPGLLDAPVDPGQRHIAQAIDELAAYWTGERHRFEVPMDPFGTAFQRSVWAQLLRIPRGAITSYGEIAAALGGPAGGGLAARAVGAAVGRNPLSIIVPCHRVLGRSGALTGYAGGLVRKSALLQLEGAAFAATA